MTVGAINGIYQYTNTYQNIFFGSTISDEDLDNLMQQYGIIQSGDEYTDISALYSAMYSDYETKLNTQSPQTQTASASSNIAWASVMKEAGLTATGNLDTDYAAFTAQVQDLEQNAETSSDKEEIEAFASQAQSYFTETNNTTAQATEASGSDIVSALNQAYVGA